MIFQDISFNVSERADRCLDGIKNIHAVTSVFDHPVNAAYLPLDPAQGYQFIFLIRTFLHNPLLVYNKY